MLADSLTSVQVSGRLSFPTGSRPGLRPPPSQFPLKSNHDAAEKSIVDVRPASSTDRSKNVHGVCGVSVGIVRLSSATCVADVRYMLTPQYIHTCIHDGQVNRDDVAAAAPRPAAAKIGHRARTFRLLLVIIRLYHCRRWLGRVRAGQSTLGQPGRPGAAAGGGRRRPLHPLRPHPRGLSLEHREPKGKLCTRLCRSLTLVAEVSI